VTRVLLNLSVSDYDLRLLNILLLILIELNKLKERVSEGSVTAFYCIVNYRTTLAIEYTVR